MAICTLQNKGYSASLIIFSTDWIKNSDDIVSIIIGGNSTESLSTNSGNDEPIVEVAEDATHAMPNLPTVSVDGNIPPVLSEVSSATSTAPAADNESISLNQIVLSEDPANWIVNNYVRIYVAVHGFKQTLDLDFEKSKRQYGEVSRNFH